MSVPRLIVQQSSEDGARLLAEGLQGCEGVSAVHMKEDQFWSTAPIDALYLSLTRAERFGSRPPRSPHVAEIIESREPAMPRFIVTGITLHEDEDATSPEVCVPLIVRAIFRAVAEHDAKHTHSIRTVGICEFELAFPGPRFEPHDRREIGRLLADAHRAGSLNG